VLAEYPDAELYLCGDGALREDLEAQVDELGIGEAVTFLGHVPYDEMPKVYRSGDVLVLPSRAEGVPRTVLEAMASGVGIVMNDLDQVSSALNTKIETFSSTTEDNFSREIKIHLQNRTIGKANSTSDTSKFQWKKTVEKTTEELKRIQ
jgi:glycosyltransferase involved in cell wall biosynthesis